MLGCDMENTFYNYVNTIIKETEKYPISYRDVLTETIKAIIKNESFNSDNIKRIFKQILLMKIDLKVAVTIFLLKKKFKRQIGEDIIKKAYDTIKYYAINGLLIKSDPIPIIIALYHLTFEFKEYEVIPYLFKVTYDTWKAGLASGLSNTTFEIIRVLLAGIYRTIKEKGIKAEDYILPERCTDLSIFTDNSNTFTISKGDEMLLLARIIILLDMKEQGIKLSEKEISIISKGLPSSIIGNLIKELKITQSKPNTFEIIEDDYQLIEELPPPFYSLLYLYIIVRFLNKEEKKFRLLYIPHVKRFILLQIVGYWGSKVLIFLIIPLFSWYFSIKYLESIFSAIPPLITLLLECFLSRLSKKINEFLNWVPNKINEKIIKKYSYYDR